MKKFFRILAYILATFIGIAIIAVLLLQIEDSQNPEIETFIAPVKRTVPDDSNAFYYATAFDAAGDVDVAALGKQVIKTLDSHGVRTIKYPSIKIDEHDVVNCSYDADSIKKYEGKGCLNEWMNNRDKMAASIAANKMLAVRFRVLASYPDWNSWPAGMPWSHESQFPPFQAILVGEKILLMMAVTDALNGNQQAAMESLQNLYATNEHEMERADFGLNKVIFAAAQSNLINLAYDLYRHHLLSFPPGFQFPSLSHDALAFDKAYAGEMMDIIQKGNTGRLNNFGMGYPSWITRVIIKPNMLQNWLYPNLVILNAYARELAQGKEVPYPEFTKATLLQRLRYYYMPSEMDYYLVSYPLRINQLNDNVRLFNALVQQSPDLDMKQPEYLQTISNTEPHPLH